MSTQFLHRLIIVCPVGAKLTNIVSWLQTNIGADSVPNDLGPPLSASGADPASHRWCCTAVTDLQCREILKRMCVLASVTPPTNGQWSGWTGPQKRQWFNGVRNTIWQNFGIGVQFASNANGQWDSPTAALAAVGLKVIAPAPV